MDRCILNLPTLRAHSEPNEVVPARGAFSLPPPVPRAGGASDRNPTEHDHDRYGNDEYIDEQSRPQNIRRAWEKLRDGRELIHIDHTKAAVLYWSARRVRNDIPTQGQTIRPLRNHPFVDASECRGDHVPPRLCHGGKKNIFP